jgi:hypothetical protein
LAWVRLEEARVKNLTEVDVCWIYIGR